MVSVEPFVWKELQKTVSMTKLLKCETRSKMDTIEPFYIQVNIRLKLYTLPYTAPYTLHLYSTLQPSIRARKGPWLSSRISFSLSNSRRYTRCSSS